MSTYVLIHGAWHGSWCWDKVVPLFEEKGHKVITPDLPGHGDDKTPIQELSLQSYANRVCEILDIQDEPVILVGHSVGGAVITQVAEYRPDKIGKIVYLAGVLLPNGEFVVQNLEPDKESLLHPNLIFAEDQSYVSVKEEAVKDIFYNDCSEKDIARAKSLLVNEATVPLMTPLNTTSDKFGRIPRIYITCKEDKTISPAIQEKMYSNIPCEKVISMGTGHSPFFSAPEELAGHLLSL